MPKIYLINVGANTAHSNQARSPIFEDGTWIYVPFPDGDEGQSYTKATLPFVRVPTQTKCHLDPDWDHLTYGDCCYNQRARALLSVVPCDILLFWGLLWRVCSGAQDIWRTAERGWYLIGALRVEQVLESGQLLAPAKYDRVRWNAHVTGDRVQTRKHERVFLGEVRRSRRFHKAVNLEVGRDTGLLRQTVRTKDGRLLEWNRSPRWNSVTRSCRAIIDLETQSGQAAAWKLAEAISEVNPGFELLAGLESNPADLAA